MSNIKIGGVPEHFNLPFRLAIEEGDFKQANLNLHWSDMGGGTGQMIRGLESRTLDVAVLLTEGITLSILKGSPIKILGVYVSSPLHWGIHVPYHSEITKVDQLENQTFAISRYGSGSHLMAFVRAYQEGWDTKKLKFNVVGDVYGGLWALENNEAQAFLWEKYTTFPFTEQKKCRYIDEVVTPWPCFVIAAHEDVIAEHGPALQHMVEIVNQKAWQVKQDPNTVDIISWRYNLRSGQVLNWLNETDWNYHNEPHLYAFEKTIDYLKKMELLSEEESNNWQSKLFYP